MDTKPRVARYFQTLDGKRPYKKWFDSLKDKRAQAKVDIRIRRAERGNLGDHKGLGEGLIELRIPHGPGIRIYISIVNDDEILLLLMGGDKSTQKEDIKKAKDYLNQWRQMHG